MTAPRLRIPFLVLALVATLGAAVPVRAQLKLEGSTLTTARHTIELDPSGLPAQITIRPEPADLPLPLRRPDAKPTDSDLQAIGRGPQLRGPVRLQAVLGGQTLAAQPAKPAPPALAGDVLSVAADLQAGALKAALRVQYAADGSLTGTLQYGGQNVDLERLELVVELAGPADTAVAGAPAAGKPGADDPTSLAPGEGVVWDNLGTPGEAGAIRQPGVLTHFFLGNGDRGFTWLTPDATGFSVDDKVPTMAVERGKDGLLTWRIALVNTPTKARDPRTLAFALLTHPTRARTANRRQEQWTPWPGAAATPALAWAARKPGLDLVRADAATVHESFAARTLLAGPAGGDAASAAATLADTIPLGLFRYFAAPHTGLAAQMRPNAAALAAPGAAPACDRMALGRALLHDIGADVGGLGQRAQAATVLRALDRFGCFASDGQTEFLPYWRTAGVLRYGEPFVRDGEFETTAGDPMARARVSVYLRPAAKDPAKTQALFVVVNEGDKPLREQFYVQQPARLFGGPNKVTAQTAVSQFDYRRIPADSDWRQEAMAGSAVARGEPWACLLDAEDGGFVRAKKAADDLEIYGLLFVPARSFRLLYGAGAY
jgi:hypothetical protein